ncbi:MAG TPA: glycosyltransferase family 2 protein [Dehalococcoidia bacterium]|nr:glycosyltransferase family 2 protein [Dehalococcoidia bacterium]
MAIEARPSAAIVRYPLPGEPSASSPHIPRLHSRSRVRERIGDAIPLTLSLLLITFIFWAPFHSLTATVFAVSLVGFYVYWVGRSYSVAAACWIGLRRINRWKRTEWPAKYAEWRERNSSAEAWDWPRHLVIIPNYRENEHELARTLDSLAAQANAGQLVVALAMEEREAGAQRKAARLLLAYRARFGDIFATFHPAGIPGETPGKGSNEAWAARQAHMRLIEAGHGDLGRYTVTSCDADAFFDPHHFEALNYLFLTSKDRYRAFWQPAIFNSNNIWDIPAPLRLPDGLSGVNRLANLVLPMSVKFPTSCYALSWQMLTEVDYWDEEVIPEDWHVYLKCCFALGDRVHVEPLYLPLGNDCVLADGYRTTLRAHYTQSVRHAWGSSDVPYAWRATFAPGPLSRLRRWMLAANLTKVHVLWAAQWYIITLGMVVPTKLALHLGAPMPDWWLRKQFTIPGPGWHLGNILTPQTWFAFDETGLIEPRITLSICGLLIAVCIVPLFALIAFEYRTRGPRPAYVSRVQVAGQFLMWPLMAAITFVWASLPALHAQWKLASGRGLVYRVAQKGGHNIQADEPFAELSEAERDAIVAAATAAANGEVKRPPEHDTVAAFQARAGNLLVF